MIKPRCMASSKTSIKRCRNYSNSNLNLCTLHRKTINCNKNIQTFNGVIFEFDDLGENIVNCTNPIFLWKKINEDRENASSKNEKRKIEYESSLIKKGSQNLVFLELRQLGIFLSEENILSFFQRKKLNLNLKLKQQELEKAKHFLGVIYYFIRHTDLLIKLQFKIRIFLKYGKKINIISKIQKWYRYRKWFKSLPISPSYFRKHYIPNTNKIIFLQRKIKKYIEYKVKHSHNCPYSMEDYWNIPKKFRVVYKYIEGDKTHWRYYDIRWLHSDFLSQTSDKRFVIDPSTRKEFPVDFVEDIARQMWILTRIENNYDINDVLSSTPYLTTTDWIQSFQRRTLYRFSLMVLDLCNYLDIRIKNIQNLRKENFKLKYHNFYLQVMPILKNIARNIYSPSVEEDIFYITRDMFRSEFIFQENDISDLIAGDAIYGILRIIISFEKYPDTFTIVKSVIQEYIINVFLL